MKKAKFFLAATAVLGIVGGAFALKAHRGGTTVCYSLSTSEAQFCPVGGNINPNSGATSLSYVTVDNVDDCTATTLCTAFTTTADID